MAEKYTVERFGLSHRRACSLIDFNRSTQQYKPKIKADDEHIRKRLNELAKQRHRWGVKRLHVLLRREGILINHKRTERIYREEKLLIRMRKRNKLTSVLRVEMPKAERPNQRLSMDFIIDSLSTGRRFKSLTIVDDFSKESPAILVDTSIPGKKVVETLERICDTRGYPEVITVDNGPEFSGKAMDEWAYQHCVKLNFIAPGKPQENAYAETFNGKFRDECLNENWFMTIQHAKEIVEVWRLDYNEVRPHSSLGNLTPVEFRKQFESVTKNAVGL